MKLLIVTSELLEPANVLSSTFELTQAQILASEFDVAILSVNVGESLSARCKAVIKSVVRGKGNEPDRTMGQLLDAIKYTVFHKQIIRKHIIEGITVYESIGYSFVSSPEFGRQLAVWIKAGFQAFKAYKQDKGLPDVIHAHGRFLNAGALALAVKQQYGIPYAYTEHSTYYQRGIAPGGAKDILNAVINNAAAFITVSKSLLGHVERFLGRTIGSALVIPNVLDKVFEEKKPVKADDAQVIFTNVASLDQKKGIDVLISAFGKAFKGDPRYVLNICGDGHLKKELIALSSEIGIASCINFTGQKNKSEVRDLLGKSHVFVLSSRVETFGVVVIEALAQGCPVIATVSGGPEYIVNEDCGLLVDPDNVDALAGALQNMVEHYRSYNRDKIRQYALEHYGSESFKGNMKRIYESISA